MSLALCGPAKGTAERPYRCSCCRAAFADEEQVAVSMCWSCSGGGNPGCGRCREQGVFFDRFADPDGRGHRLARRTSAAWIGACGVSVPRAEVGQGIAVVPPCRRCWPEPAAA